MATKDATKRGSTNDAKSKEHSLPDKDTCVAVLKKMLLIRRFEERAGEMYAKAKIGGFLHLCIGEEATIVGATQALRDDRLPALHLPRARPGDRARHAARTR